METCPKCHCYMDFHIEYFCGNPYIFYTCPCCGHDDRNVQNYATSDIVFTQKEKS